MCLKVFVELPKSYELSVVGIIWFDIFVIPVNVLLPFIVWLPSV